MTPSPEVYTSAEIARAAGVSAREVEALIASGALRTLDGRLVSFDEAFRVGRALSIGVPVAANLTDLDLTRPIFSEARGTSRSAGLPAVVSSTVHMMFIAAVVWMTTLGATRPEAFTSEPTAPLRLVFMNIPGPGGGGGGGGLKQPKPPPKAMREGRNVLDSPLPVREPPPPIEKPKPVEPPKPELKPEPLPPIIAPVVTSPANQTDQPGLVKELPNPPESRGPGDRGGVGTGSGPGLGEGQGSGIGDGSGGGTGGGPYRAGAGIDPPRLLREVKPEYTDDARRRGISGDVLLEIVVRHDGSVGEVRVLRGLGYGLDARAADAVRQWRFAPARRQGSAVDVIVEVSVEFKLR